MSEEVVKEQEIVKEEFNLGEKFQWPKTVKIEPCSANSCSNGHKWAPQAQLAQCKGCGGLVLVVRLVNCPVCNEPVKKFKMTTHHVADQSHVGAVCRGQKSAGEIAIIEMERQNSQEVEAAWDENTGRMKE